MIFEDGEQRRDFVYVGDVARAFADALELPQAAGEVFNIGSGHDRSVTEVAQELARAMGKNDIEPGDRRQVAHRRHPPLLLRRLQGADEARLPRHQGFRRRPGRTRRMGRQQTADDRVDQARAELEARGLVA
jgi:dTDP-L-rhamnose 4-epimerase